MTISEWKNIICWVKKNKKLKWFVFLMILSFRGMRPQEALAINVMDFIQATGHRDDYSKITYREAKTNKVRVREHIIKPLAQLIKTYVDMNNYFETQEGYLFYHYRKRYKGMPFMSSRAASVWFAEEVRNPMKKDHEYMREWYPITQKNGYLQKRYRINLYSFRRWFETYIYMNNEFAPRSIALIKEIMDYNSKFDPIKHYIRVTHTAEHKMQVLENTMSKLASNILTGQKNLTDF